MPPTHLFALLVSAVACAFDLRTRRIPNLVTLGAAVAAFGYNLVAGGPRGLMISAAAWLIGVAIFFLPFALGGMGAGDVKLLGALGAWLGPSMVVWLALYTGVAGAVLALLVALARGYLGQALRNIRLLLMHWRLFGLRPLEAITLEKSNAPKLAYAVPILIGTVITIWAR